MWYAGFRRDLLIETDRDIQKRMYVMVTSLRMAVAAHGTRSTNTHTAGAVVHPDLVAADEVIGAGDIPPLTQGVRQ